MTRTASLASALAFGLALTPAAAQESLVNVNLEDVRLEIAKDLNLNLENVPVTILLPVSLAANLCGLEAGALAARPAAASPAARRRTRRWPCNT